MEVDQKSPIEEDVIKERVDHLIEERIPWLFLGLLGGLFTTFIVSKYEAILSSDIRLSFFIPIVVYLSGAVGTQTETIFVRRLSEGKRISFAKYLLKESAIGLGLGIISGIILGIFANYWLKSSAIGITVGLTLLINLTLAPILAVFIPRFLYRKHSDPALGSGPVATIIQDLLSLMIFFLMASIFVF
jgi:magnesium transporter